MPLKIKPRVKGYFGIFTMVFCIIIKSTWGQFDI
jgi:hypothetical protein